MNEFRKLLETMEDIESKEKSTGILKTEHETDRDRAEKLAKFLLWENPPETWLIKHDPKMSLNVRVYRSIDKLLHHVIKISKSEETKTFIMRNKDGIVSAMTKELFNRSA